MMESLLGTIMTPLIKSLIIELYKIITAKWVDIVVNQMNTLI